jgi:hypothetical protein
VLGGGVLWLPRSGVGASGDAPASRRVTGRRSGRTTLPRWSVGAIAGGIVGVSGRIAWVGFSSPSPRAGGRLGGGSNPAGLRMPAQGVGVRPPPRPSPCPGEGGRGAGRRGFLAPTLRRGSKGRRSSVASCHGPQERPHDTPTQERGSDGGGLRAGAGARGRRSTPTPALPLPGGGWKRCWAAGFSGSHAPAWEQGATLQRRVVSRAAGAAARHSHAGAWERWGWGVRTCLGGAMV